MFGAARGVDDDVARDMTTMPTIGGIYALFDLGGAPLDPRDVAALGIVARPGASAAAVPVDAITPMAVQVLDEGGRLTLFLGHLDERAAVADRLGMAHATPDVVLARAGFDRFGAAAPAELLGGWSMLERMPSGIVTMLAGIAGWTPMLYALAGNKLAVAPSISALSCVPWIGRSLDEDALLLSLTICTLDDDRRTRAILRGVRSVPRGGCVTIAPGLPPRQQVVDPFIAVPRWTGSRRDAMAAAEALLRRVVREKIDRSPAPGLLLSGGLDSSLIAWATATESALALPALTSAIEVGREVPDETPFAEIVAETLALPLRRVVPARDAPIYRPTLGTLEVANAPPLSPRDYLYAAFADHAAELNISELFDGGHGELTFTGLMPVVSLNNWLRAAARRTRNAVSGRIAAWRGGADMVLNVALAPHRHRRSAEVLADAAADEQAERWERLAWERWGYSAGARAPLRRDVGEWRGGRLRMVRPFHDIRLLRLFAGFPAAFMIGGGMTRWPARVILAGRLPDTIRLRRSGMPFSPDYDLRLVEQAPTAIQRISTFRAMECDEWFDLDWLREGLSRIAGGKSPDLADTFRVQLTAHACEFLTWWRGG